MSADHEHGGHGEPVAASGTAPAVEADPHFSPDGQTLAFTSNRSGVDAVYTMPASGGDPTRLTWYPASSNARGWTRDGQRVLYASSRETARRRATTGCGPSSREGGPSTILPAPWGTDASYSPDGERMIVDRVARWDSEWRAYRGGQNTPLTVLNLQTLEETDIPNPRPHDRHPACLAGRHDLLPQRPRLGEQRLGLHTSLWRPAAGHALYRLRR